MAYTLKITEDPARYTAQEGNRYELTGGSKRSAGTVSKVAGTVLTLLPGNAETAFTATVSGTRLTALNGRITWTDDTSETAPGSMTLLSSPYPPYSPSPASSCTITFDSRDGSAVVAIEGKQGTTLPLEEKPASTRTGYTFNGWFPEDGGEEYVWPYTLTANITMYAQWTPITYTITYHANDNDDATGDTESSTHTYDTAENLTANGFKRDDYDFKEWASTPGGGGAVYGNGASVSNLSDTNGAELDLYAQWNPLAPIKINLQPVPDDPVLTEQSVVVGAKPTFNAGDYAAYQWYWNGESKGGGSSYTLTGEEAAGIYELSVVVTDSDGEGLSARCRVTITAK